MIKELRKVIERMHYPLDGFCRNSNEPAQVRRPSLAARYSAHSSMSMTP